MANYLIPKSFQTLINIKFNYWKQSKDDLAKHYLLEAIQKSPCYNDSWIYYDEALVKTNYIEKAECVFIQILKYGEFLLSQNEIKNAKQQFKIAPIRAKKYLEIMSNIGDVYFLNGKFDKAIFNYYKGLEINPNLILTLCNLGTVYFQICEYQKAVNAYEKPIELDPENNTALRDLAVTHCNQDNMLKSVETYKKCLKLLPDDIDINLEFALIYDHNLKNFQEAENCFKKCIKLKPQREDVYKKLFAIYQT
ncbi:UDP-N-acetylglucosamine--peptide N-acetylglucosaminyltransferase 110 kDa subunit-like isoform X3 [Aphis craccivora]|uniref:UDP-N-acetylglucosamine--peptide N-acetylglucosaminyltransferase 110 kDa subunit-like isoform X3 n=1 Tax=Aphis craccivora TaxID=307492 RepID=A0A6G0Y1V6_APHCR|nr:UDP-N-acetylglucosamine--peptide N-acetylglucosaminyltransferase 110 kDa subunit-like isoform X3 [Aphis craccivora]